MENNNNLDVRLKAIESKKKAIADNQHTLFIPKIFIYPSADGQLKAIDNKAIELVKEIAKQKTRNTISFETIKKFIKCALEKKITNIQEH